MEIGASFQKIEDLLYNNSVLTVEDIQELQTAVSQSEDHFATHTRGVDLLNVAESTQVIYQEVLNFITTANPTFPTLTSTEPVEKIRAQLEKFSSHKSIAYSSLYIQFSDDTILLLNTVEKITRMIELRESTSPIQSGVLDFLSLELISTEIIARTSINPIKTALIRTYQLLTAHEFTHAKGKVINHAKDISSIVLQQTSPGEERAALEKARPMHDILLDEFNSTEADLYIRTLNEHKVLAYFEDRGDKKDLILTPFSQNA